MTLKALVQLHEKRRDYKWQNQLYRRWTQIQDQLFRLRCDPPRQRLQYNTSPEEKG